MFAALLLLCVAGVAGSPPAGLVDWARHGAGAHATSSHDGPLCWGPPTGTFADGLLRYCTSVDAAFDGKVETFWAEVGGMDGEMPHPSPASPAWVRVAFPAPVRLRGARVLVGTSLNYTVEVSSGGPAGPWRILAEHGCGEDLGCALGFHTSYLGGYDPTPEARGKRREVTHVFDSGALVTHARWRNTWANLGGYACGDVCLWSNLLFELELWGDPPSAQEQATISCAALPKQHQLMPELAMGSAASAVAALRELAK